MNKYCFLLFLNVILLVVFELQLFSQTLVDSLYLELANSKNDTVRVEILNEITREFRISDTEKAFKYNARAINLAKELNYLPGIARAYSLKGTLYRYSGDDLNAMDYYNKSKEYYEQLKDSAYIASLYNYMGQIFMETGDSEKTLSYHNKALDIYRALGDEEGLAIMRNNIAVVYNKDGRDSLALIHFKKAYEMNRKIGRFQGMGFTLMNIGTIHFRNKLYEKALDYYYQSLVYMQKAKDLNGLMEIKYNLGNIYVQLDELDSAYSYLLESKEIANKYNVLWLRASIALSFAELHFFNGNCREEAKNLNEYISIKDSLYRQNLNEKILEVEKKFEFEKKIRNQEFELIEKSRKLKISRLQKLILSVILIALIIIGWILINRKKIKIRFFNEKLKAKNNELVSYAMYILQKNDLIHTFRKQLLQLQRKLKIEDNKNSVDEIINSLIFKIAISKDIEEFRDKLRDISEEFYGKLEQKFPDLTEKEKQLATLLRLNLSSKQMAVILNISPDSVDINRHRLRKKLNIPSDLNLMDFFNRI